ncbi:MAG: hypothetical protein ABI852_11155, partial [Gemmatimonadaceae bacterium]
MITKLFRLSALCTFAVIATACSLDETNPNAPTQGVIFNSREGVVSLAVGLQARYGAGLSAFAYPGGLIADEMGTPGGALQSYKDAEIGALAATY